MENKSFFDSSTIFLLFTNIATIIIAVIQNWSILNLLWIYWLQSVIIGVFNFKKILNLKSFSTANFKINGKTPDNTKSTQTFVAFFFAVHYGIFHFVYMMFLFSFNDLPIVIKNTNIDILSIILFGLFFYFNHLISYRKFKEESINKTYNIGNLMFKPYIRIVPMHLTIIFFVFGFPLLLFMTLKTIADVIAHKIEHRN